jgi:hypothetical protein
MKSEPREVILSRSNAIAAIEELLHRLGEIGEDDRVELPWKVEQFPIKIYQQKEDKVYIKNYRPGRNGKKL